MYVTRINEQIIKDSFLTSFVTAILGSRRVGKSTIINHYAENHPECKWIFLNMDRMDERQRVKSGELKAFIAEKAGQVLGINPKLWVVIDEAQKCPEIFDQIKVLYDEYKDKNVIKFILSGSGFLTLHKLGAESLAGRIQLQYLREFNLQETTVLQGGKELPRESLFEVLCEKKNLVLVRDYITELMPFKPRLQQGLKHQLIFGGLPEVIKLDTEKNKWIYLADYLQTYLEKDVHAVTDITNLQVYQNLLRVIAEQTGSVKDDQKILQALGCSRETLKKYRGYLEATLFYQDLYPFIGSSLKRLVKSPKGYLLNNGLISYLTGIDSISILESTGMIGHRLENWFLKELHVWLDRNYHKTGVFFWRTSTGVEVDFIVKVKSDIFPFEVTNANKIEHKKVNNLLRFLKEEPRAHMGFYVYQGDYYFDQQLNVCFLPAWAVG